MNKLFFTILNFILLIIATLFSFLSLSETSFPYFPNKKTKHQLEFQTEYFYSNQNYTNFGNWKSLENSSSKIYQSNFLETIEMQTAYRFSPSKYNHFNIFYDALYIRTKTDKRIRLIYYKPKNIGFGILLYKKFRSLYFKTGLKGAYPLYTNNADNVIIGDGLWFVESHMGATYVIKPSLLHSFIDAHFKYRPYRFSSLFYINTGFVLHTYYTDLGIGSEVFFPVIPDSQEMIKTRHDRLKLTNGGSFKYNSANPVAVSFSTWMKWKTKFIDFSLFLKYNTYGQSYARGITVGAKTSFNFGNRRKRKISYYKKYKGKKSFKNDTHEDEEYFEEKEDEHSQPLKSELKKEMRKLR